MTGWETPRGARLVNRRAVLAIAAIAVAVLVAVGLSARAAPGQRLEVTTRPATEGPDVAWQVPERGTWRRLPIAPLASRGGHTMVWTGTEIIVWGGFDIFGRPLLDGAAFNPATGDWRLLAESGATNADAHSVWTGADVVLVSRTETFRYDPTRRRWRAAPPLPVPEGHTLSNRVFGVRWSVVAVTEPFVRDGTSGVFALHPGADRWQRLPDIPTPLSSAHVMVPDRGEVWLFGPADSADDTGGLRLDPWREPLRWEAIEGPPGLDERQLRKLVATAADGRIVLWGASGDGGPNYAATRDDRGWRRLTPGPLAATWAADALWVGDGMIVWDRLLSTGAILDPARDLWTSLPAPPIPTSLPRPTVWTGSSIVTWGAFGSGGAMYTPA